MSIRENIKQNSKIKRFFRKDVEEILIRFFIAQNIKNYDDTETYIIYNENQIEIYHEDVFLLKQDLGMFKSFYISRPIVALCTK